MTDWTTRDDVRDALGLDPADTVDDAWLDQVVAAVNQFVDDTRPPLVDPDVPVEVDPRTAWGATQLGTRWYSRRNSNDLSAFAEFGGVPPSIDRDIAVALRIDRYFRAVVA